jgi:TorA maturation chaperone TorD
MSAGVEQTAAPDAHEEAVRQALERASLYRLLGAAFAYPDAGGLAATAGLAEGLTGSRGDVLGARLARLAAAAREAEAAVLADEHVFLFDRASRCPPYEGAWGDAPQMAGKGALLADVAGFYRAFGLVPAVERPDVEDHVAAECEFMSALALKEAYALAESLPEAFEVTREAQVGFLRDHLGRWAATLAGALREATPLPYYQAVADLLEAWTAADVRDLGAEPVALGGRCGFDPIQEEDAFSCPMACAEPPEDDGPREEGQRSGP